jgi:hypothetical protein
MGVRGEAQEGPDGHAAPQTRHRPFVAFDPGLQDGEFLDQGFALLDIIQHDKADERFFRALKKIRLDR